MIAEKLFFPVSFSFKAPGAGAGALSGPDANLVADRYILHDRLYQWGLSSPFSPQPPRPSSSTPLASYIYLSAKCRSWLALPWDHSFPLPAVHHELNAARPGNNWWLDPSHYICVLISSMDFGVWENEEHVPCKIRRGQLPSGCLLG